jgi:hypothetical protein
MSRARRLAEPPTPEQGRSTATSRGGEVGRAAAIVPAALGVAVVVVVCLAWSLLRFGSLSDAFRYARGSRVVIDPPTLVLPPGRFDDRQTADFRMRNLTSQPVRVLGATVSCDCVTTEGLPTVIDAGGSLRLRSSVHLDARSLGPFVQSVLYYTDHPAAPSLRVVIRGEIRAEPGTKQLAVE